ncbi:MAG: BON domain-containing protein [Planctomycetia bacterium]|nr:BON domain-containing protein [Planctomycetia bacterium]
MSISRSMFLAAIVVALATSAVHAEDLAANVATRMKESAVLKGYRVNVKSKAGTVWLEGTVADAKQIDAAIAVAEEVSGVERVVNRLTVDTTGGTAMSFPIPASIRSLVGLPTPEEKPAEIAAVGPSPEPAVEPAAETAAVAAEFEAEQAVAVEAGPAAITLTEAVGEAAPPRKPAPKRIAGQAARPVPQARRPSSGVQRTALKRQEIVSRPMEMQGMEDGYLAGDRLVDGQMVPGTMRITEGPSGGYCPPGQAGMGGMGGMGGGPMPMGAGMRGMGGPAGGMPVPVRGDGPNMPNYAWPSYAAYPNYAALQYPTQYSPTAWPYIGPFYPYPQVPLGWRRVSLEWDDGWWWLDFDERRHIHSHHR